MCLVAMGSQRKFRQSLLLARRTLIYCAISNHVKNQWCVKFSVKKDPSCRQIAGYNNAISPKINYSWAMEAIYH
jgi:hypothetical protein